MLLIEGDRSVKVHAGGVRQLQRWLPHLERRLIPGAGHIPPDSRPLDFQAAIMDAAKLAKVDNKNSQRQLGLARGSMIAAPKLEKVTSKDGTQLACWVSGEGPPLLMIHGTTADHTSWRFVLPALQEHFTVYAVDRRGRGDSGDADAYTIGQEYEDVSAMVDSIGKPVNVLGHSYGATLAVEAALKTNTLRRLVLYEPPLGHGTAELPGIIDRLERLIERDDREAALEIVLREIVGMSPADIEQVRSSPVWPLRIAAVHTVPRELKADRDYTFRPERFSDMRSPTLLLLGSESPSYARKGTEAIAAALPDARIVRMPGQGHYATVSAPELFAREVISFLDV